MRTQCLMGLALALAVGRCAGQDLPEPEHLRQALDDVSYAELLNGAALTEQQLDALLQIQARLQADDVVGPDVAAALTQLLRGVLGGLSVQEAQGALGPLQQALQQAQQRWQQSLQQSTNELQDLLAEEQKSALIWLASPAHGLDNVVGAVSQARDVPDAQWNQFRAQVGQALSQGLAQADVGGGATPEKIGGLLDQVRAMDDATFDAQRGTLAQAWLATLMPSIAQRLQDPQFRQQLLSQVCQRLITYERGATIIEAKREVAGQP